MKRILSTILIIVFMLSGCASEDVNHDKKINIVTSTTMLGDLVKQIGQDMVHVDMLFGPGIDPHLAMPTGGDTRKIQVADLVVFNGLHLEAHFDQILNAYENKTVLVGDNLDRNKLIYVDGDAIDPHIWFDLALWQDSARFVGEALIEFDNENKDIYEENLITYLEKLDDLHQWTLNKVSELDKTQKVLVTAHDAFNYFANAYDFEVAAISGISTEGEVTTQDINDTASIIIDKKVKAIFLESSVPQTMVDAVISEVNRRGQDVTIGESLFSDAIGVGEYEEFINAFKFNVESIVEGLK